MRVCYFDLETTNLVGDLGRLLCGSILRHDGTMVTFRQDEFVEAARRRKKKASMVDDGDLAEAIRDELEKHHIVSGWFSKGFDIPFLNTRLAQNGRRLIRQHIHFDPRWYMSGWRGLKPRSAKLAVAAEFFGLDEQKMAVGVEVWARAQVGEKEALDILVERCESDVRLLKEVSERILETGVVKNLMSYP